MIISMYVRTCTLHMCLQCSSCDFEAVPRVLKEHELLHFLPDELKLTSPEDIKKWREERKK